MQPTDWQDVPTVFERASAGGFRATVIAPERYRLTGFSEAVLRGADFIAGATIVDRFDRARDWLAAPGDGVLYVYVPELDATAHAHGWQSPKWTEWLELLDAEVAGLVRALRKADGLFITADHGVIDVPGSSHVLYDQSTDLLDGVAHVAGEPRCLQLYFDDDLNDVGREAIVARWRASEADRAWVATRDEAIEANWFGPVRAEVAPRIGDLLVAARKAVAYYDSTPGSARSRSMIGQHGSWSADEVRVPLIGYGAFSR
jgi:hypothetical protein